MAGCEPGRRYRRAFTARQGLEARKNLRIHRITPSHCSPVVAFHISLNTPSEGHAVKGTFDQDNRSVAHGRHGNRRFADGQINTAALEQPETIQATSASLSSSPADPKLVTHMPAAVKTRVSRERMEASSSTTWTFGGSGTCWTDGGLMGKALFLAAQSGGAGRRVPDDRRQHRRGVHHAVVPL